MKRFILFLLLPLAITTQAQQKAAGDTLVLHKEKYPNGKLAAYSWILQSTGNGHAACWDKKGQVMFESDISRNHGHHSVYFEHHENKVVKKIEESSAPDAGIQWYRSYYYFDENGVKTGESHDSHDDRPSLYITGPTFTPTQPQSPPQTQSPTQSPTQTQTQCAVIFQNELVVTNQTNFELLLSITSRGQHQFVRLKPKQSSIVLNEIQAQFFSDPAKTASIHITALNKARKAKGKMFSLVLKNEKKTSGSSVQFEYDVEVRNLASQ